MKLDKNKIILFVMFLLTNIMSVQAQPCPTLCITPSNTNFVQGQVYSFSVEGDCFVDSDGYALAPEWDVSSGLSILGIVSTLNNYSITVRIDTQGGHYVQFFTNGWSGSRPCSADMAIFNFDSESTSIPYIACPEGNCDGVGLTNGSFENNTWLNSNWIRKSVDVNQVVTTYSNAEENPALQACNDARDEAYFECSAWGETQGYCASQSQGTDCQVYAECIFDGCMGNELDEIYQVSNEHEFSPLAPDPGDDRFGVGGLGISGLEQVLPVALLQGNNQVNDHSLILGRGDGEGNNSQAVESIIEQTFVVEPASSPRLDIWYGWAIATHSNNGLSELEIEQLTDAPVFAIKIYKINGLVEELIYNFVEKESDHSDATIDEVLYKPWGFAGNGQSPQPLTIDLTPLQYETIKVQIISYDRFIKDATTGEITERINSCAFVDIVCNTCCVKPPDLVVNETSGTEGLALINILPDGVVAITPPNLPCLSYDEPCTPNFFYQITSPKGEPYVLEGGMEVVKFKPEHIGTYSVQYKQDISCCWSEPKTFPVSTIPTDARTFSNDLKSAAIHCVPSFQAEDVLAVGAVSFVDRQFVNTEELANSDDYAVTENYLRTSNPFITGERGVWRTEASYAYVTDRRGHKDDKYDNDNDLTANGVQEVVDEITGDVTTESENIVEKGGTFSLDMMNWQNRGVLPDNWRKVNQVSRYNTYTSQVESRDILGRYSSALYGYNGQLSTAVCANASYNEIGFESFEDNSNTSHISIENNSTQIKNHSKVLQVLWAKGDRGVVEGFSLGEEGSSLTFDASLIAYVIGKQDVIEIKAIDQAGVPTEQIKITLTYRNKNTCWFVLSTIETGQTIREDLLSEQWYGSVSIVRNIPASSTYTSTQLSVTEEKAHAGKRSIKLTTDVELVQPDLVLYPTKEYVVSTWVSTSSLEQEYSYGEAGVGVQLIFIKEDNSTTSSLKLEPTGNIIEGWQRIEGRIKVPQGTKFVKLKLFDASEATQIAYYDDIRIFPANGSMKTYVYDPQNYLLRATLDANNYASLYFYDEEQRIYLVQKETEEGIQTIQETRSYIKENE